MSRNRAFISLNTEDMTALLHQQGRLEGIPKTAQVVRIHYSFEKDVIILMLQDDSFEEVKEGCQYPQKSIRIVNEPHS